MSKPFLEPGPSKGGRNDTPTTDRPPPPPPQSPAKPQEPKPPPTCSTCPCWHKSSRVEYNETCRFNPPMRDPSAPCCRSWPHTIGTDSCFRHPVLQAQYQAAVAEALLQVQRNGDH